MITFKLKGMEELLRELRDFKRSIKFASKEVVDGMAIETQKNWREVSKRTLVERNQFFPNMIQVERARVTGDRPVIAKVGLATDFGRELEQGGTTSHKSNHSPIPAPAAAGIRGTKRPRKVWASRSLVAVKVLPRPTNAVSLKQSNAIAMAQAKRAGRKFALLERKQGGEGLFLISGGRKKPKTKLLFIVGRSSVHVRPHPTLEPALQMLSQSKVEALMQGALQRQVDRRTSWGK